MKKTFKIVLVRHGESTGNIENRFTGWLDVDLTKNGHMLSYSAGIKLKKLKYNFDICYTSMLRRAIKTSWAILDALDLSHIKIVKDINLNERHYGELSGMNKLEAVVKYGSENINNWLNAYNKRPPFLKEGDIRLKRLKKKYKNKKIPNTESLDDLLVRVLGFWNEKIKKKIKKKKIIIVAHSNILKILINYLDNKKENSFLENSKPIIYEFDKNLNKIKSYNILV
ncbi:2,3-bisphosphoglycerate-dependent phosphoglycerate mutase [Candidatus Nasuia deltocephalinicola]|uniref:2,3-bisphosphoglycerate-dependent phosphoglycerate mutase n=1 Tax=Candidatus Nasuia deltocephalincola TaxID=1160784 RepID=UPI00216AF032|nr:2,3-bisphosphoglycerate-dependent phosphoglycerate mutase [Candidatus Nasuia deltocephalinicola]